MGSFGSSYSRPPHLRATVGAGLPEQTPIARVGAANVDRRLFCSGCGTAARPVFRNFHGEEDAAQSNAAHTCYWRRKYGLGGRIRRRKDEHYGLKVKGVAATFLAGRIPPGPMSGGLVEYQDEGYCYF